MSTTYLWETTSRPAGGFKSPVKLLNGDLLAVNGSNKGTTHVLNCFVSHDNGRTWQFKSEMLTDSRTGVDMGDGHIVQLANGQVLYSFRHNRYVGLTTSQKEWNIEILESSDNGSTWSQHSTVSSYNNTDYGLWSSFLFLRNDGVLQCYYDDEYTPAVNGFVWHQWATMKTWNGTAWVNPVIVSRAFSASKLSRDGMCSVVQTTGNNLICAIESVQTTSPFRGCIRMVTSTDGGAHWSWSTQERKILYAPDDITFNALAPWMIKLSNGELITVFTTDEDRAEGGDASTGNLSMDLKFVVSNDAGLSWTKPNNDIIETLLAIPEAGVFFPGIYETTDGQLIVQYLKNGQSRMKIAKF